MKFNKRENLRHKSEGTGGVAPNASPIIVFSSVADPWDYSEVD
jgi:hypothetical protein